MTFGKKYKKINKKKTFFNNYNYEVRNKYYSKSNIIDYDVIDFDDFKSYKKNNDLYIDIDAYVRIVYFDNGKNNVKVFRRKKYTFKKR
ncbi:MAG: hypothetical protein L6V81_02820 [Clostridium sp.]|nr:MAG: hypothetical protein L6V81_02820 [Clostridium sp.]